MSRGDLARKRHIHPQELPGGLNRPLDRRLLGKLSQTKRTIITGGTRRQLNAAAGELLGSDQRSLTVWLHAPRIGSASPEPEEDRYYPTDGDAAHRARPGSTASSTSSRHMDIAGSACG